MIYNACTYSKLTMGWYVPENKDVLPFFHVDSQRQACLRYSERKGLIGEYRHGNESAAKRPRKCASGQERTTCASVIATLCVVLL